MTLAGASAAASGGASGGPSPAAPPDDELVATLVRAFGRVARRIRPTADDLSAGHFSTLATLDRLGPHKTSDLARVERMAPPSMTRVVQALEGRGLVERVRSADDARCVLVSLTATGRTLLAQAQEHRAQVVRELLAALTPGEHAALAAAAPALASLTHAASVGGAPGDGTPPGSTTPGSAPSGSAPSGSTTPAGEAPGSTTPPAGAPDGDRQGSTNR